jgi:hypothetical protein
MSVQAEPPPDFADPYWKPVATDPRKFELVEIVVAAEKAAIEQSSPVYPSLQTQYGDGCWPSVESSMQFPL